MARPKKIGLDYFPCDVKFDQKFEAFERLHKNDGIVWMLKFWQLAYQSDCGTADFNGIYGVIHAENCRITHGKHLEIIKDCLQLALILEPSTNIFTSNGIQKRIEKIENLRKYDRDRKDVGFSVRKRGESKVKEKEKEKEKKEKSKSEKKHAFKDSPFFPFDQWRGALKDWPETKCRYWWEKAEGYSEANGGRYINWVRAVQNWDRERPGEAEERSAPVKKDSFKDLLG